MSESKPNWIAGLRDNVAGPNPERRREQRRYLKVPIEVRTESGTSFPGYSRDLSQTSMGAVVSTPLKAGQRVLVAFELPVPGRESLCRVEAQAIVRQCLGFRYGFEFAAPLEVF